MTTSDLFSIFPILIVAGWASLLLLVDLAVPHERKGWTAWLALAGLAAAFVATVLLSRETLSGFGGMVQADPFANFLNYVFLFSGAVGIVLARQYNQRMGIERGEYYTLLLFTVSGMMLMASAADLIVVFLALELLSIPLYLLYCIALTYGATRTTSLAGIVAAAAGGQALAPLLLAGAGLILVGLGFKVAAAPFHMWTPDVYEGAPSAVTAFMSVGAKAGGFAALLRVFVSALPALAVDWVPVVVAVSALTMTLGNVAAIAQSNIKRMLAYSSIAHAGYILMALVAAGRPGGAEFAVGSALFYLLAYTVTNLGAWGVVIAVERRQGEGLALDDYAGLGASRPGLALAMALFMLSLTGLPPTVGFIGKFYVFRATLEAGQAGLALIGVLTSLVSAYYYLRVVIIMYMRPGPGLALNRRVLNATVGLTALATFLLGIFPAGLMELASRSALTLFGR
ncbi:MAG: NADH-quinone oxidoreductase subunit N [Chloroflexi bacterium]|nr:NADH-quinone oxidoreductase subunit N [Chloroflexota bacterium]